MDPGLTPAGQVATLAHEVGHQVLHYHREPVRGLGFVAEQVELLPGEERQREIEAELTAFFILAMNGLDPTAGSSSYLANWKGNEHRLERAIPHAWFAANRVLEGCREVQRGAVSG